MNLIRKIRSKVRDIQDGDRVKLKFVKNDQIWHVLKNETILYLGDEQQCRNYMSNLMLGNT